MNEYSNLNTKPKTKKAGFVVTIVVLSLCMIGLAVGVIIYAVRHKELSTQLENAYMQTYFEFSDSVNNIELNLSKMLAVDSDVQLSQLALETYRNSEVAQNNLSKMPLEHIDVVESEKFLNQVGDWCYSFNQKLLSGDDMVAYRAQLEDIYIGAKNLSVRTLEETDYLLQHGYKNLMLSAKDYNPNESEGGTTKTRHSVDYPELIYDGPFSENLMNRDYDYLFTLEELNFEQTVTNLIEKIPYEVTEIVQYGQSQNKAKCYELNVVTTEGDVYVSVSPYGATIMNFNRFTEARQNTLTQDEAQAKASEYAKELGFDVSPIWYNEIDGIAYINMAPIVDDITYYTDLVKVKVALDDGDLLGLESKAYCMNHKIRDFKADLSKTTILKKIPSRLTVKNIKLAVVPKGANNETLAYMVGAEYLGLDYFIMYDANTGTEIEIMRVIDEDQGAMVI